MDKFNILPGVLSYEKKLIPSDGYFYGVFWDDISWEQDIDNKNVCTALKIREKTVRGTNSTYKTISRTDAAAGGVGKKSYMEDANIQTVDTCFLGKDQDTLRLSFTLKILPMTGKPSACDNEEFQDRSLTVIKDYIKEDKFKELAKRYAWNIASGRFLWRNRVGAKAVKVTVSYENEDKNGKGFIVFNALGFSLRDFENIEKDQKENFEMLTNKIASVLSSGLNEDDIGKGYVYSHLLLNIDAYALIGRAQEVYPSEEFIGKDKDAQKKEGDKSKVLYSVTGKTYEKQAAMHSQKIGNALRTIDTWYPLPTSKNNGVVEQLSPIPIEVYGSVTHEGIAYRKKDRKAGHDFFNLFKKFINQDNISVEDKYYVIAMLIRGGVFGEKKETE